MLETTIEINDVPHPVMYLVCRATPDSVFGSSPLTYADRTTANNAAKQLGAVVLAVPVIADYRD